MSHCRILVLGGGEGWHAQQLRSAASASSCELKLASYESLSGKVSDSETTIHSEAGALDQFDAILTRTMPAGSLEQITFRLATLHSIDHPPLINSPAALEIAIDKFATLARVAKLGYPVPKTEVVQTRSEAMEAFDRLGGDCVVKPIFGGEGRGVMRVPDRQLAWYTFSTLESVNAVSYLQEFVAPGGVDTRLLVFGDHVVGIRRHNPEDFRTNVSSGGNCRPLKVAAELEAMAIEIVDSIGLQFASVDLLDTHDGGFRVLEVNGIPGWKGAQRVVDFNIAARIIDLLRTSAGIQGKAACL
ncbi:MAG: RimK family alpha-L-glutamate ligase [Pirellulales bacterium]|nr:RimK family alpha-L-glutamate ligase [Pirellulales bacterium]